MAEFVVAGPTRVCAVSGRTLTAGERFYGVLSESAGVVTRTDYAAECWTGPPPNAVAYWFGRIPEVNSPRRPTIDDAQLLALFTQLATAQDASRHQLRYAVTLLLMRRKKLKFEDVRRSADPGTPDVLIVRDARTGTRYDVPDPHLTEADLATVQDQVLSALGWTA
jgi:hypothetical protein